MGNKTLVSRQEEWIKVAQDLEAENLKLMSYDSTLLSAIGNVKGQDVLDYGAGPGVLALALQKLGARQKVYDISLDMLQLAASKIGRENVFTEIDDVPSDAFDVVICNLVVCIVPEETVKQIVENIRRVIKPSGVAYIGFCNPKIYAVRESQLDLRCPTGQPYRENHDYKKIKKEGGYEIVESHRPIEWYGAVLQQAGLNIVDKLFTPTYELNGIAINDFIIFKLQRPRNQ